MQLPEFCIRRPVFAIMLVGGLVLFGAISGSSTGVGVATVSSHAAINAF